MKSAGCQLARPLLRVSAFFAGGHTLSFHRATFLCGLLSLTLACGLQEVQLAQVEVEAGEDLATLPPDIAHALRALPRAVVRGLHRDGVPSFVAGDLGMAMVPSAAEAEGALLPALGLIAPVFRLEAKSLRLDRVELDELGMRHARYAQVKNGLEVVGGELIVHVDHQGTIYAVNGAARDGVELSAEPSLSSEAAVEAAGPHGGRDSLYFAQRLAYVISTSDSRLHLAWEVRVEGELGDTPMRDLLYLDARTGELVDRRPLIHTGLNRRIYSANNTTVVPGSLRRSEGGASSADARVNLAYDSVGTIYNFYKTWFNRDSYNGSGAAVNVTVHYGNKYPNAYWDGYRMVLGSGDGVQFANFAESLDITAHEMTHAVIDYTAKLAYQNEPGALNEAWSDIMASAVESWSRGGAVDARVWMIGEDIYSPKISGDALRYMGQPTKDGSSYDYYPERYTGGQDYGGVHFNSGIANLAFKLLVTGGKHPRNKTSTVVSGIGMEKATRIFYRALAQYLTSNSNFQAARTATRQAAQDLYGQAEAEAVDAAWTAVGVPGATTSGGGSGTSTGAVTVLENGKSLTQLSAAKGNQAVFTLQVPAGAQNLKFAIAGGTGDADLYVRYGAAPTTSAYDLRPYLNGNNETATAPAAQAGTWYVMVHAYAAYSGLSLTASFTAPLDPGALQSGVAKAISGATGSEQFFTFTVPQGATGLSFRMSGGTGDADLYVRHGQKPTTSAWDFRPYIDGNEESVTAPPTAGTWHVMVKGYQAFAGAQLVATYQ